MKLLGLSCRLECCILCIVIGAFIGANLFCSCITKEGFNAAGSAINAPITIHNIQHSSLQLKPNSFIIYINC
jgi:hypothetical protein